MQYYDYESIKNKIREWYHNCLLEHSSASNLFVISKDEKEALIIDMTFEHCLAQLEVADPIFAPYKHVAFLAMTGDSKRALKNDGLELIYFFYDAEDMHESEVIDALNLGVKFSSEYKPDAFGKR